MQTQQENRSCVWDIIPLLKLVIAGIFSIKEFTAPTHIGLANPTVPYDLLN